MNTVSNLPPGVTDSMIEDRAAPRYEVVESKVWQHKTTKQKVSPYGACPWQHESQKHKWELIPQGWTIYDSKMNQYGMGRKPWQSHAAAQLVADGWNSR